MPKQSAIRNLKSEVVVVGAGPAGASLAIRLAAAGRSVTLFEKERFPREKLCGEFISPECFRHFAELGVREEMLSLGGARLTETRFFDAAGRSVAVPTRWFGHGEFALSLSRARMDAALLDRAREAGVAVIEGARTSGIEVEGDRVRHVAGRSDNGERFELGADLFVDATGRAAVLSRLLEKDQHGPPTRSRLVAFKNHLRGVEAAENACEIYVFEGGYGGLSPVEDGKANLCFIVKADAAREIAGKPDNHLRLISSRNSRAAESLRKAEPVGNWLAVPVGDFGRKRMPKPNNLIAIGDAAAFIDPFTGSGMLMALESAEIFAKCAAEHRFGLQLREAYAHEHRRRFRKRLAACAVLRRAAFVPQLATAAIIAARSSDRLRERLAKATRAGSRLSGGRA